MGNFEVSKRVHKKRNRAKATPDGVPATEKDWITKRRRVVTLASGGAACAVENVGDDMVSMAQSLAASLWTSKHAQEEELQQSRLQDASGPLSFTDYVATKNQLLLVDFIRYPLKWQFAGSQGMESMKSGILKGTKNDYGRFKEYAKNQAVLRRNYHQQRTKRQAPRISATDVFFDLFYYCYNLPYKLSTFSQLHLLQ